LIDILVVGIEFSTIKHLDEGKGSVKYLYERNKGGQSTEALANHMTSIFL